MADFLDRFAVRLNAQQLAAIRQTTGAVLLLAVPGSGKTTVLVTRLGYLLYECNVYPEQILTMTYTVAATQDMRARFIRMFGEEQAERLEFRTINSVCARIIQYYARVYERKPFTLITQEATQVLRSVFRDMGKPFPTDLELKEAAKLITYCKNMMLRQEEINKLTIDSIDFPKLYFTYCERMTRQKKMDFDDQMVIAYQILRRYPDILQYYQQRYRCICVDEAQDTSKIQHKIIWLLAQNADSLFMVGDEDQSIYGFRAAYPQALLNFSALYPNAKVLLMETNYRSTKQIVAHADAFITHNQNRYEKHMHTINAQGAAPRRVKLKSYLAQYTYLLKQIKNTKNQIAILYRNNDSAIPLIDILHKNGIPFQSRELDSYFFSHPVVQDLTSCMQLLQNPYDIDLLEEIYYKLSTGLKKTQMQQVRQQLQPGQDVLSAVLQYAMLEEWQKQKIQSMQKQLQQMRKLKSFQILHRVIYQLGYSEYLSKKQSDFNKVYLMLALAWSHPEPIEFLQRLVQLQEIIKMGSTTKSNLILSTIHSSKGLEYDEVMIIDAVDGIFPTVTPADAARTPEDASILEEERRLFYVGATRARKKLTLLDYPERFGKEVTSTFINEFLPETVKTSIPIFAKNKIPRSTAQAQAKNYFAGLTVNHRMFGMGVLEKKNGEIVEIRFADGMTRKLDLIACLEQELLSLQSAHQ